MTSNQNFPPNNGIPLFQIRWKIIFGWPLPPPYKKLLAFKYMEGMASKSSIPYQDPPFFLGRRWLFNFRWWRWTDPNHWNTLDNSPLWRIFPLLSYPNLGSNRITLMVGLRFASTSFRFVHYRFSLCHWMESHPSALTKAIFQN